MQIGNAPQGAAVQILKASSLDLAPVNKTKISALVVSLLPFPSISPPAPKPGGLLTSRRAMSVITLNMAKETGVDKIVSELRATPAAQADLLLLQEVKQDRGQRQCAAEHLAASLGLHVVYSPAETGVT